MKDDCNSGARNVDLSHWHKGTFMEAISITVNGKPQSVEVTPDTPLLWVLRDTLGLTGTKFGCGMALCGACTVHVDGGAARSLPTPNCAVAGRNITTIGGVFSE